MLSRVLRINCEKARHIFKGQSDQIRAKVAGICPTNPGLQYSTGKLPTTISSQTSFQIAPSIEVQHVASTAFHQPAQIKKQPFNLSSHFLPGRIEQPLSPIRLQPRQQRLLGNLSANLTKKPPLHSNDETGTIKFRFRSCPPLLS